MLSKLNRMILWELIKVFILSLIGITTILVLVVVVMEAQNQGLGMFQVIMIVPLVIPSTLPYTIPTTTLFATCVVYGRLAHDNEILAIKAAGINILHIIRPALLLGVVMSITTAGLYYKVIPTTYHMMKTVFLDDLENVLYAYLKKDGRFTHPKLDYEIYVQRVENKLLIEAQFMHRDPDGNGYDVIARAKEAELLVDNSHRKIYVHMRRCWITGGDSQGYVKDKIWPVDFPPEFGNDRKSRRTDLTWKEIDEQLDKAHNKVRETESQIATTTAQLTLGKGPKDLSVHLQNLRNVKKNAEQTVNYLSGEKHRRLAIAAGCFCFVLVGCPVGIWFSRSDYLSAFVTCFLPIVLLYYPLILCGDNLVKTGEISPWIGLWPANLVMIAIAFVLYRKMLRN